MRLVIDAGNTNIVFAVHDRQNWAGTWRIATEAQRTSDEYAVWLLALLDRLGIDRAQVSSAVIGTVVPAALYHLRRLCREWFDVEPLVARPSLDWGFAIRVDNPSEVGADRLVNALAAYRLLGAALIVIDFGTATTFDVVGEDGGYEGGIIAPGINLSIEALHQGAARLPRIGIGRPRAVIGRGTVSAMQSGIYWGYIAMIEGLVARIRRERTEAMSVVVTGGLAPLFSEGTDIFDRIEPDLTLTGLRLLAERNPAPIYQRDRVRVTEGE